MSLHRRPIVLSGLAALATSGTVVAQPVPGKIYRIGVLSRAIPKEGLGTLNALRELGYEEGRNLTIDFRLAQGRPELLPTLASELVAAKPDVLLAPLNQDAVVLKQATSTIPIVMLYSITPVELGLVDSLARPGGNLTGTTMFPNDFGGKTTQLLRDAVPRASSIAALIASDEPGISRHRESINRYAAALGVRINQLHVRTVADLDQAFLTIQRDRPDALHVAPSGVIFEQLDRVIEFAARHKLPAMHLIRAAVVRGGLMSYSANFRAMALRNSSMIDKIFKGTRPSDIPVEEPVKFDFVINMKTAKAMGIVIPPTVLLQATELIE